MKKKHVFCEFEFLNEFLSSCPRLEPNKESMDLVEAWISFYNFLLKAHIILNISATELGSMINKESESKIHTDSWLQLWKSSTDGRADLEFKDYFVDFNSIDVLNDEVLNAVFLTMKDDSICIKKSKELGVYIFNLNLALHCNHLFCDNGHAFPCEEAKNWDFIKGLNGANCKPSIAINNSMLIIDNYLLCDDKDENGKITFDYKSKLEQNLKPILQNILPIKMTKGVVYDIKFFVSAGKKKNKSYYEQYQTLQSLIKGIRNKLYFKLSIFIGQKDKFHDRSIVTNNTLINSGHGFGILKDEKTNTPTSINIVFPFFQTKLKWCDDSYLNIMHTAKDILDRLHEPNINCWGDHQQENTIISYYNKEEFDQVVNIIVEKPHQKAPIRDIRVITNTPVYKKVPYDNNILAYN